MDLDIGKIGLENKMYAVDLTVLADQGSIGAADANKILTAGGRGVGPGFGRGPVVIPTAPRETRGESCVAGVVL
jgi:hypothetical protein